MEIPSNELVVLASPSRVINGEITTLNYGNPKRSKHSKLKVKPKKTIDITMLANRGQHTHIKPTMLLWKFR